MSREFEVTYEMELAGWDCVGSNITPRDCGEIIMAALAHPDFRAQLRAYVAEQMRGLVPAVGETQVSRARAAYGDACVAGAKSAEAMKCVLMAARAETLANIEKWANLEDAP